MVKSKVTISLDEKRWTDFRIRCLKEKISASEIIEKFIGEYLKNKK